MTMNDIMDRAMAQTKNEKKRTKEFIALYRAKNTQDVDWVVLCNDLKHYGCYKLGFFVIYELLKANEYVGTYKNALCSRLDFFHEISKKPAYSYHSLFCGMDITNQVVFRYQKNENQPYVYSTMRIKSVNKFIRERFGDFLNTGRAPAIPPWFSASTPKKATRCWVTNSSPSTAPAILKIPFAV